MDDLLETYLKNVDRRLRTLPVLERTDIIQEIHSEMRELEASGLTAEEIVTRLGDAKGLAAAYLGESIARQPGFSWTRFRSVAAFYSLAGLSGLFILPVTSVAAVGFLLSGALAPVMGLLKFIGFVLGYDLPFIMFQFGAWQAQPPLALVLSVVCGVLLAAAGWWLWQLTVRIVRTIGQRHQTLRAQ